MVQRRVQWSNEGCSGPFVGPLYPSLGHCILHWTTAPFVGPLHPSLDHCTLRWTTPPFVGLLHPLLDHCTLRCTIAPFVGPLHPSLYHCTLHWTIAPSLDHCTLASWESIIGTPTHCLIACAHICIDIVQQRAWIQKHHHTKPRKMSLSMTLSFGQKVEFSICPTYSGGARCFILISCMCVQYFYLKLTIKGGCSRSHSQRLTSETSKERNTCSQLELSIYRVGWHLPSHNIFSSTFKSKIKSIYC